MLLVPSIPNTSMLLNPSTRALFSSCGIEQQHTSNTELINGSATNEQSAVVPIYSSYDNGKRRLCTGTFINDQEIITAAHCVIGARYILSNGIRSLDFKNNIEKAFQNNLKHPIVQWCYGKFIAKRFSIDGNYQTYRKAILFLGGIQRK